MSQAQQRSRLSTGKPSTNLTPCRLTGWEGLRGVEAGGAEALLSEEGRRDRTGEAETHRLGSIPAERMAASALVLQSEKKEAQEEA